MTSPRSAEDPWKIRVPTNFKSLRGSACGCEEMELPSGEIVPTYVCRTHELLTETLPEEHDDEEC